MLTALLEKDAVPFATLHARYGSLLELVRKLIGVVPNCDPYLEIWPPAFRIYNVMVPNFLNLPLLIWGMGAPRDLIGLAMYAASRTAECAYCSAHCCSFAMRRGASADAVAAALDDSKLDDKQRAVVALGKAMARIPAAVTAAHRDELARRFSAADGEWIVLSVAMMGFLNKWMDAIGVALEPETIQEVDGVIAASGWTPGKHGRVGEKGAPAPADGFFTKLSVLRYAPSALSLDKKWTAGVPDRWPAAGEFLRAHTGHDFPILSQLTQRRAIRALGAMLRESFDAKTSVVGLAKKRAAGLIYAEIAQNENLAAQLRKLGPAEDDAAVSALARAVSPSPAMVDAAAVEACRPLPAAVIIEVVTFISVLQLLHRLEAFYP